MTKRKTTEEFKNEVRSLYGSQFDFDEETVYLGNKYKVSVICKKHGKIMIQPDNFLHKHSGCPYCNKEKRIDSKHIFNVSDGVCKPRLRTTPHERIERAKTLYNGFYGYFCSDFSRSNAKAVIICPIHGEFAMSYDSHVNQKHECPKCKGNVKLTQEEFAKRLNDVWGDEYDVSKAIYKNMHENVTLICQEHGEFQRTPIELLYFKRGCPLCNVQHVSLENEIEILLQENEIIFETQKKFDWLGLLSLDFYLPQYNVAIECQGKQHFGFGGWSTSYDFEKQRERDERKYKLCKDNGIKMLYFSNIKPKESYFDEVFTDKGALLNSIRYL